jgi:ABC-type sugar transport system ATPase subunit
MPFGDAPLPEKLRSRLQRQGGHPDRMKFRTKVDVVESMGSEIYVYFDVETGGMDAVELDELASHGDGRQIVARLSPESRVRRGGDAELSIDTNRLAIFGRDRRQSHRRPLINVRTCASVP